MRVGQSWLPGRTVDFERTLRCTGLPTAVGELKRLLVIDSAVTFDPNGADRNTLDDSRGV